MLRISERILRNWADVIGIDNLILAEHDYRISYILKDIYSNVFLKNALLLKGGTAINKLHLSELSRLSVDLDFNQIGSKDEVLSNAKQNRQALINILKGQDPTYIISYDHRYEQTTIHAKYNSIIGHALQPIKLEISHIERFPILRSEKRRLFLYDSEESIEVGTYRIEELLATKLRAVYDRTKARDLYDLDTAFDIITDKNALKKMFIYYFYRDRKVFSPKIFFGVLSRGNFQNDVMGFIKSDTKLELTDIKTNVREKYDFIGFLDEKDNQFLNLAKVLLGKQVSKEMRKIVAGIEYPFKMLFDGVKNVNADIFKIKTEEIKIYKKPPIVD